jgi:Zn-dependent metalloprotease
MCRYCRIVPSDVLLKLSNDKSLSTASRQSFSDTMKIDIEVRKLRAQARRLTQASRAVTATLVTIAAAPAITVYDCGTSQTLPGAPVQNPGNSPDQTAKTVSNTTTDVAAFYQKVFGRNSIDNAGMTMMSSIHYGVKYNNAFWNGSQMTYGDGDGDIFVDFSKGNDVVGHELTHGVTQHTLQLAYANEPGGLNESISDVFGSMFRQWEAKQTAATADWLIGKDIMGPAALGKGLTCLRDMAQPGAQHCLAPQPDNYAKYTPGMDPHYSSGIANLAFYKVATAMGGQSWDKAGQIWYRALTGFGPSPNMKMSAFSNRTRQVVSQHYPGDAAASQAVDQGWKLVGL